LNVVRTQIYLPESLHRAIGRAARRRGVSMAELIREAAEAAVGSAQELADPLEGLLGNDDSGPADMAERHDEYLSGLPRRRPKRSTPRR
jgi:ribbon-helix-helix CopG family protein